MKNIVLKSLICIIPFLLSGCLWVLRVPFPMEEKFSDDGTRTNAVYRSFITDMRRKNQTASETNKIEGVDGIYPLTKIRCSFVYHAFQEKDFSDLKGRDLYNAKWTARTAPFVSILMWLGEPLDLVIDTLVLPWDLAE